MPHDPLKISIDDMIKNTIDISTPAFSEKIRSAITQEISLLHDNFKTLLDKNWLKRFSTPTSSRAALLELAFLKHFSNNSNFYLTSYQGNSKKDPDFEIILDNKKFIIELTSIQLPNDPNSELRKAYKKFEETGKLRSYIDYDIGKSINEYKARLTNAISNKKKQCEKIAHDEEKGFVLFISSGEIPFVVKPDLYHHVHALCGLGDFSYSIEPNTHQVKDMGYAHKEKFKKNDTVSLSNKCFDDNPWISGIILSWQDPFYFFDFSNSEFGIYWNTECHNDFVLVHNPHATKPLPKNIFPIKTEISIDLKSGRLLQEGIPIFPDYSSILS